jgi:hypothetical protein
MEHSFSQNHKANSKAGFFRGDDRRVRSATTIVMGMPVFLTGKGGQGGMLLRKLGMKRSFLPGSIGIISRRKEVITEEKQWVIS